MDSKETGSINEIKAGLALYAAVLERNLVKLVFY